jgi:hypothetical protein
MTSDEISLMAGVISVAVCQFGRRREQVGYHSPKADVIFSAQRRPSPYDCYRLQRSWLRVTSIDTSQDSKSGLASLYFRSVASVGPSSRIA